MKNYKWPSLAAVWVAIVIGSAITPAIAGALVMGGTIFTFLAVIGEL